MANFADALGIEADVVEFFKKEDFVILLVTREAKPLRCRHTVPLQECVLANLHDLGAVHSFAEDSNPALAADARSVLDDRQDFFRGVSAKTGQRLHFNNLERLDLSAGGGLGHAMQRIFWQIEDSRLKLGGVHHFFLFAFVVMA